MENLLDAKLEVNLTTIVSCLKFDFLKWCLTLALTVYQILVQRNMSELNIFLTYDALSLAITLKTKFQLPIYTSQQSNNTYWEQGSVQLKIRIINIITQHTSESIKRLWFIFAYTGILKHVMMMRIPIGPISVYTIVLLWIDKIKIRK